MILIGAAGNEGTPPGKGDNVIYPARYQNVIAIAATDQSGNRARWSSTGPAVELSAPGVSINSTYLNDGYAVLSGTSMAAPHVSGVVALLWAKDPTLTNIEIRKILQDTATDLGPSGRDSLYGYGLVNAYAAMSAAGSETPEPKPLTVNMVYPADGLIVKGTVTIQASVSSDATELSVEYGIDSAFAPMVFSQGSGDWEAEWDTAEVADGAYTITVKAEDNVENSDKKTVTVTVANDVKSLYVTVESDKTDYSRNSWVYITVTVTDGATRLGGASVEVRVYDPDGAVAVGSGMTGSDGSVMFRYRVGPKAPTGTYSAEAEASLSGYETGNSETSFKVS